ncbi:uncharacterized protein LOC125506079 [Triticum urartu]|uniref:uncharacterized protein LOC125506079 n=1 Tax=Triticum urartu TaxID=4572 RepID=UPI0020445E47|nr:uncharacterized protein LOC125506079 [Triticum urartu]
MAPPWVLRAGRAIYRAATQVIDHRTPETIYRRHRQIQQRGRQVQAPPRPIRDFLDQHGHQHQAAVAGQRTAGEAVRVACGEPDDPFGQGWLVLRGLVVVSDVMDFSGHEFGFLCRVPPRPSTVCLLRSTAAAPGAIYEVQASHGDVLLVRRTQPKRPAVYMVLDIATSSAIVLPGRFSEHPLASVGVMRREHDVLVPAILQEGGQQQGEEPLEMMCLSAFAETSCHRLARAPYPAGAARPWGRDGSVAHGDSVFFIDYSSGLIRFQALRVFASSCSPAPARASTSGQLA